MRIELKNPHKTLSVNGYKMIGISNQYRKITDKSLSFHAYIQPCGKVIAIHQDIAKAKIPGNRNRFNCHYTQQRNIFIKKECEDLVKSESFRCKVKKLLRLFLANIKLKLTHKF